MPARRAMYVALLVVKILPVLFIGNPCKNKLIVAAKRNKLLKSFFRKTYNFYINKLKTLTQ